MANREKKIDTQRMQYDQFICIWYYMANVWDHKVEKVLMMLVLMQYAGLYVEPCEAPVRILQNEISL